MGSTEVEGEQRRNGKGRRGKGGFEGNIILYTKCYFPQNCPLICQRKVGYKVFGLIGFGGVVKVPFRR